MSNSPTLSTRPDEIPALTGLRAIGAGWVVSFHFQGTLYEAWPPLKFLQPIFEMGALGVPLFFILSGYIIWHNYGNRSLLNARSTVQFFWRRIARLWPVNVATLILVIPVIWWGIVKRGNWGAPIPDWYSLGGWIQSAFMVEGLGYPTREYPWNQPAWSLTAEMLAYAIFPALLALILMSRMERFRFASVWIVVALGLAYFTVAEPLSFSYRWLLDMALLFIVGVILRIAGMPRLKLKYLAALVQLAAPIGIIFASYIGFTHAITVLLAAWVWSLAAPSGPGVWFFSLRSSQIAGLSSYSLYMLHWVLFGYGYVFLYYFPVVRESYLLLFSLLLLCMVYVGAWLMWAYFETPARKLLNRGFERAWPRKKLEATTKGLPVKPSA